MLFRWLVVDLWQLSVDFEKGFDSVDEVALIQIIIIIKKGQQCTTEREWYTPYPVWKTGISINLRGIAISAEYM